MEPTDVCHDAERLVECQTGCKAPSAVTVPRQCCKAFSCKPKPEAGSTGDLLTLGSSCLPGSTAATVNGDCGCCDRPPGTASPRSAAFQPPSRPDDCGASSVTANPSDVSVEVQSAAEPWHVEMVTG